MGNRLYVGNLAYSTTESGLTEIFSQAGTVVEVAVIMDRETGRSKGFAFVTMGDDAQAAAAIQAVDGKELDGRALRVAEAKPREERSSREERGPRW